MRSSAACWSSAAAGSRAGPSWRPLAVGTWCTSRAERHALHTDGPFAETAEQLSGFYALRGLKRFSPGVHHGPAEGAAASSG